MADQPSISVIIPAHDPGPALMTQLDMLLQEDVPDPWEVIVVDNRSTDGWPRTAVARMETRLPVRLVSADRRPGASYARNVGADSALGQVLLFCDADDAIRPGWVRAMAGTLQHADVAAGPYLFSALLNAPEVLAWHGGVHDDLPESATMPFGYLLGGGSGNMGVTAAAFRHIGGFDETFTQGAEDLDFCFRAQEAGLVFAFTRDAIIDVRMRETIRGMLVQHFNYGVGAAQLYSRHSLEIARRQTLAKELRELWVLMARTGEFRFRGHRERLLRDWAGKLGRLRGGLKARRLIPPP